MKRTTATTWCRMCGGQGDVVDGDTVETCPICGGSGEHPVDIAYGSVGGDQPPFTYNGAAEAKPQPDTRGLAVLLGLQNTGRHVYAGSVPAAVVGRRRAKNRAARRSRRINRRASAR